METNNSLLTSVGIQVDIPPVNFVYLAFAIIVPILVFFVLRSVNN